jgi:hypothetical protein
MLRSDNAWTAGAGAASKLMEPSISTSSVPMKPVATKSMVPLSLLLLPNAHGRSMTQTS